MMMMSMTRAFGESNYTEEITKIEALKTAHFPNSDAVEEEEGTTKSTASVSVSSTPAANPTTPAKTTNYHIGNPKWSK